MATLILLASWYNLSPLQEGFKPLRIWTSLNYTYGICLEEKILFDQKNKILVKRNKRCSVIEEQK
jgi:hypothetical protein